MIEKERANADVICRFLDRLMVGSKTPVNERDGIRLSVLSIDPQGPYARCIINDGVLESTDLLPVRGLKFGRLYINLDMMAWHLLLITMC